MNAISFLHQDKDFNRCAHAVTSETVKLTEELLHKLNFCNNAKSALLTGVQCLSKSKNVFGWLIGCIQAILKIIKMHSIQLKTNLFCSVGAIENSRIRF
jgi:hypothetical protein